MQISNKIKKNKKGMSLVEVMVAMILSTYAVLAGTAFFVRAFRVNYDYSEYTFKMDRAINYMEQKKMDSLAGARRNDGTAYTSISALRNSEQISGGKWSAVMSSEVPSEFVNNPTTKQDLSRYGGPVLNRVGAFASWPIATEAQADAMAYNGDYNYGENFQEALKLHKQYGATDLVMLRTYSAKNTYKDLR